MRVLVIGTSGQLATELTRAAARPKLELVTAERFDVSDERATETVLERAKPELILNASAYTAVDRAESEPERAFAVNAAGPGFLAQWCEAHGSTLFHVSTDYVFDGAAPDPYTEKDLPGPLGVYGASKLAGEEKLRSILQRHVILRTSWVFSAHGQNFVRTILRLCLERPELRIVADQRGRPTPARELSGALLSLAERLAAGSEVSWGTYHFAGTGHASWHELAEAVVTEQVRFTGKSPKVTPIATHEYPTPARRPQNSVLDTTLFEQTFGITPAPWREGLATVIRELLHTS